jgi:hypothetical protein
MNQWFDEVKADLVVNKSEIDENGDLLSEVRFQSRP